MESPFYLLSSIFLSDMKNNFIPYPYLLRELDFFTDPLFNAHLFIFIISLWCMLFDPTTISLNYLQNSIILEIVSIWCHDIQL